MSGAATAAAIVAEIAAVMERERDRLCELDGAIGDADHGLAMAGGFRAAREAAQGAEAADGATGAAVLAAAAKAFLSAVGASSGPLYATAMLQGSAALKGSEAIGDAEAFALVEAFAEGIARRGKAEPGDKTMLDAWAPAAEAARAAREAGATLADAGQGVVEAARRGAEATRDMVATKGRAARLGERARGHVDPGAASAALVVEALLHGARGAPRAA
jgi:dihydroxyacetone kinase-like protein